MSAYRIVVHHPNHGTFYSEPWEMTDDVRKDIVEHLRSCAANRDVLSFNDDEGDTVVFPPLMGCVVELRRVKEDEENE